ncbi:DNA-directed RNA polymerase subunit omega [Hypnocyclicus thermotrophus]|uniref:DNA-directed RNA polymerase subunit omega n=1 Tax=Hypnocyclicus thermotrophus TaxID=1627895 RepID=A0AA46DXL2_9FUSO|nr:DNA-directed RNA polymerase subunit omega [Hypnocyclicus thermotrophus]TDT67925.1 DNA-directed RNA polymerase subunit omega [Hypnocyclicus thermotrophus]
MNKIGNKKKMYDELIEKIPNKYILTIVAGRRGRNLLRGEKPVVKVGPKSTMVQTVFKEILKDKINYVQNPPEKENKNETSESK